MADLRVPRLARALVALAWASIAYGLASTAFHLAKAVGRADRRLDRAWERLAVAWISPPPQTRLELAFGIRAIARTLGISKNQARALARRGVIPTFQLDGVTCARIATMRDHLEALERNSVRDPDEFR